MGNQEELERKAFWRVVLWTFTVLVFVSSINIFFILNAIGTDFFEPLQRNLATVPEPIVLVERKLITPIIEFNCLKPPKTNGLITKAPMARFLFKNCTTVTSIQNETNKNQGSLFSLGTKLWTSDFISLNHGQNHIQVQWSEKTQVIEITREIPKEQRASKAL